MMRTFHPVSAILPATDTITPGQNWADAMREVGLLPVDPADIGSNVIPQMSVLEPQIFDDTAGPALLGVQSPEPKDYFSDDLAELLTLPVIPNSSSENILGLDAGAGQPTRHSLTKPQSPIWQMASAIKGGESPDDEPESVTLEIGSSRAGGPLFLEVDYHRNADGTLNPASIEVIEFTNPHGREIPHEVLSDGTIRLANGNTSTWHYSVDLSGDEPRILTRNQATPSNVTVQYRSASSEPAPLYTPSTIETFLGEKSFRKQWSDTLLGSIKDPINNVTISFRLAHEQGIIDWSRSKLSGGFFQLLSDGTVTLAGIEDVRYTFAITMREEQVLGETIKTTHVSVRCIKGKIPSDVMTAPRQNIAQLNAHLFSTDTLTTHTTATDIDLSNRNFNTIGPYIDYSDDTNHMRIRAQFTTSGSATTNPRTKFQAHTFLGMGFYTKTSQTPCRFSLLSNGWLEVMQPGAINPIFYEIRFLNSGFPKLSFLNIDSRPTDATVIKTYSPEEYTLSTESANIGFVNLKQG